MKVKERQVLTLRFHRLMTRELTMDAMARMRIELLHGGPRLNSKDDPNPKPLTHSQQRAVNEIRRVWRQLHPDACSILRDW